MLTRSQQTALSNQSDVAAGATWAVATLDAQVCLESEADTGRFLGTAYVARDLIRVVDALEEDGMLRYWGELSQSLFRDITV
jgi:hypothetical protein